MGDFMKKGLFISFNLKSFLSLGLVFVIAFFLVLSLNMTDIATTSLLVDEGYVIIVDAGHGGEDGGTQSSAGVPTAEKTVVLSPRQEYLKKT